MLENCLSFFSSLKELHNACDFPADTLCDTCTSAAQSCSNCRSTLERLQDEDILRDRIVTGIRSEETRHRLLSTPGLTLQRAAKICASDEAARSAQNDMEANVVSKIQAVRKTRYQKSKYHPGRFQMSPHMSKAEVSYTPTPTARHKPLENVYRAAITTTLKRNAQPKAKNANCVEK